MDYAIIGNGAAGIEAIKAMRELDREGKVTLIDCDPNPCYHRPLLPDYVCGLKKRNDLWVVEEGFYSELSVRFLRGRRAVEARPREGSLILDDGQKINYDRLLLACGSRPRPLSCPGAELPGVVYLRTLKQAEEIKRQAQEARSAVALGGGLLGVELARAFNELGLKTEYLIREDRFWPQMLDEVGSALVERRLARKGINVRKEEGIEEIRGKGEVREVVTSQGSIIPADLVGVAIGAIADVDFLRGSGVKAEAGILVDSHMQSSVEGIFSAGDAAQVFDPAQGKHLVNTSWRGARRSGRVAGINMAGGEAELPGAISFNVINIYGLPVACLGLNLVEGEGYESLTGDYPKGEIYRKYVLQNGRLVGATLIGDIGDAPLLEELITKGADLSGVKDRLFEEGFDLRTQAGDLLGF